MSTKFGPPAPGLHAPADVDGRFLPGHEREFFAEVDSLLGPNVTREFIHHDIAAKNFLVNRDQQVKLIDFGLAVPNTPEFRRQMAELVQAGRSPEELAREFEPTAQSIRNWVAQAERNEGRHSDGLTTSEREELNRLRRENRQLRLERDILSKAAAWFARETNTIPPKGSGS